MDDVVLEDEHYAHAEEAFLPSLPGMLRLVLGQAGAASVMQFVHDHPVVSVCVLVVLFMLPMLISWGLSVQYERAADAVGHNEGLLGPVMSARDSLLMCEDPQSHELGTHLDVLLATIQNNPPSPVAKPHVLALSTACASMDRRRIADTLFAFGINVSA